MRVAIWDGDDRAVREAPSLGKRFSADGSAERHTVVVTVRQPDEDGTASTNASVWDTAGRPRSITRRALCCSSWDGERTRSMILSWRRVMLSG